VSFFKAKDFLDFECAQVTPSVREGLAKHANAKRDAEIERLRAEAKYNFDAAKKTSDELIAALEENARLRAVVAADFDDAELIRADSQYLHAGFERHCAAPECAPQYVEQILDRALAIQRRHAALAGGTAALGEPK
jgi:hypothetical protein